MAFDLERLPWAEGLNFVVSSATRPMVIVNLLILSILSNLLKQTCAFLATSSCYSSACCLAYIYLVKKHTVSPQQVTHRPYVSSAYGSVLVFRIC